MAENLKKKKEEQLQDEQLDDVAGGAPFHEDSQGQIEVKNILWYYQFHKAATDTNLKQTITTMAEDLKKKKEEQLQDEQLDEVSGGNAPVYIPDGEYKQQTVF